MAGGMELHFFGLWIFKFRSLKFGKNRSFCGISGIFLEISASEKYFSDSGKWPFHTPPKGLENRRNEVKSLPPQCRPLRHSKTYPKIHRQSSAKPNYRSNTKNKQKPRCLYTFRVFLVFWFWAQGILGCILGLRGVLYFVPGTGDCNSMKHEWRVRF